MQSNSLEESRDLKQEQRGNSGGCCRKYNLDEILHFSCVGCLDPAWYKRGCLFKPDVKYKNYVQIGKMSSALMENATGLSKLSWNNWNNVNNKSIFDKNY